MSMTADLDIFALGRDAVARARALFDGRACFASLRRLQADFTWSGPAQAACALAQERWLPGRDPAAGRAAGANTLLCELDGGLAGPAAASGLRVLVRMPFAADESAGERGGRLRALADLLAREPAIDGVLPQPHGEPQGLDTLVFFAQCRQACPRGHLVVDLESFGHKLGQLCLSFGADEVVGPIVAQRALRLGERASSNDMTRDEAALLVRAAGLAPCERLADGEVRVL